MSEYVIVRKEPTSEMCRAGAPVTHKGDAEAIYVAMISASSLPVSLEEIVEVLETIAQWAEHTGQSDYDQKDAIERLDICRNLARAALAKARGET